MALAAGAAMAIAQDEPVYPSVLDFTLNGEKEISGVNVSQTISQYDGAPLLTIKITGTCDADALKMDFVTPEGWDYALIDLLLDGENSPFTTSFTTRSSNLWLPLNRIDKNYKKGNSFNFPTNGKDNYGTIYLVKGDSFWSNSIDIEMNVTKTGGSGDDQPVTPPVDMPEYPESLDITLNGEKELPGVTVTQTMEPYDDLANNLTVTVSGKSDADLITLAFPTPEGWDYMMVRSDYEKELDDTEAVKAKAPALEDEDYWMPVSMASWYGVAPGNSVTFPVDGDQWGGTALLVKGEDAYMVSIDFIFDVKKAGGSDDPIDKDPTLPDHLDYTLNGEKELPGVKVRQLIDETTRVFSVTGECDAETITLAFDIPTGWDGMMIADQWGEGEISTVTRSADLIPVESILGMGFKEGNAITYKTDGEAQTGSIALIKGDMACSSFINYDLTVSKGGNEPGPNDDDPAYPESYVITTFPEEGLEIFQGEYEGVYTIGISGEISEPTYDVIIDVPEGWDGFISLADEDNVVIGETGFSPRKTRASEYYWEDLDEVLGWGARKGNKFTFKSNGEEQEVLIYLYKGDQVEMLNPISLETMVGGSTNLEEANQAAYDAVIAELDALKEKYDAAVAEIKEKNPDFDFTEWEEIGNMIESYKGWAAQALAAANDEGVAFEFPFDSEEIDAYITMMIMAASPAPEFPESFEVSLSNDEGVEATQYVEQEVYTISVSGKSAQKEITLTIGVPEGWDGFVCMSESSEIEPLSTRAQETEWWPIESMLEIGATENNSITFPVDGEVHFAQFLLVKDGLADVANQINVEFEVEFDATGGVSGINASEKATYFDMNGKQIAKPAKGIYVKIVDGKATKVVVK